MLVATLLGLLVPMAAGADDGALTLADCLAYAREHNYDLRIARTRTALVQARVREAGARFLPSLNLDGYYNTYDTTPSQPVTIPPNVRINVPGQAEPVPVQIQDSFTVQTTPRDPSDMKLSLTQPVFTSGKLSNALAVRRAEAGEAASRESQAQAGVDLEIERAFDEVLLAGEALALQEEMEKQTGTVLADVEHRFAEQSASRLELLEARSARTRAQMPLLRARQDLRNRHLRLTHLVGWEEAHPLTVSGRLAVVPIRTDTAALVERALAERPDLRVLAKELTVKERELRAVQLTNTPSVSLVGNYEFLQRARNDLPENVWSGGVALSWPIFEGATIVPRLQAARLALEEVTLRQRQLRDAIELEVTRAASDLEVAAEAHATQERDVETARERLRMTAAGLDAGTTSPVDLIRSQMDLLDARLIEADLRFQHAIARARLGYIVGAPPGGLDP